MARFILIFISALFFTVQGFCQDSFQKVEGLARDLYAVSISGLGKNIVWCGSSNALFLSTDRAERFKRVLTVKGSETKVNFILSSGTDPASVYVATDSGLYVSDNLGKTFSKVFRGRGNEEDTSKVLSLAESGDLIYAGTDNGIYSAQKNVWVFRKIPVVPEGAEVYGIDFCPQRRDVFFMATSRGVYRTQDAGRSSRRVFVASGNGEEDDEEEILRNTPRVIRVNSYNPDFVYLGTTSGLFISEDAGESFKKMYFSELEGACITHLKMRDSQSVFIASDRGFFMLDVEKNSIDRVYKGMASLDVRCFDISAEGELFAATSAGLYRLVFDAQEKSPRYAAEDLMKNEPSVREIQAAALRYNEVSPAKIRWWRNALKMRGLFPTITLDYDKTIYGTAGSSTTEPRAYVGPRDWGISFSWDVGDLIWNSYEDDIDTRSRLNTQLRLDVLDEVNRLYFERLRLKKELQQTEEDSPQYIEKQIRFAELTAALDGYTGGYFSKRVNQMLSAGE